MKRILVIPDSMWGNDSGNRSAQYLVKILKRKGFDVGVYAEDNSIFYNQKNLFLENEKIRFFSKRPYSFLDQFCVFNEKAINEFKDVILDFEPDLVFYFGTIRNKISIDYLLSINDEIPYVYLPLTNEFWCLKDFAGLKNGECYKCMNQNFAHALTNKCLETNNPVLYFKGALERILSKKRFINSKRVYGYSKSQLETFNKFGLPEAKASLTKIFFDPQTLNGIHSEKGDFFLISGQISDAKGWHLVPKLLQLTSHTKIKFKFLIFRKKVAKNFINKNKLQHFIDSGKLEVISELESHDEVLSLVSKCLAVIVPSNYPSTGEFALLEAMGLKKPVVAFNLGFHKDFLIDNQNSLVSSALDVNKMAKDLVNLHADSDLWKKLSSNARTTFEEITDFENDYSLIKSLNI